MLRPTDWALLAAVFLAGGAAMLLVWDNPLGAGLAWFVGLALLLVAWRSR